MAITTLPELETAIVTNWLRRSDLNSVVTDYIRLHETSLNYGCEFPDLGIKLPGLRVRQMEVRNSSFALTGAYQTLPTDFLEIRSITLNTSVKKPLTPKTPLQIDTEYKDVGEPRSYHVHGSTIRVGPSPDSSSSYTADLLYYGSIPASTTSTPNWLLTTRPDISLYGALTQAGLALGGADQRWIMWARTWAGLVKGFVDQDDSSRWGGSGLTQRNDTGNP